MKDKTQTTKRSFILRFLDMIEVAGNKLPTPLTIFLEAMYFLHKVNLKLEIISERAGTVNTQ